MTPAPQKLAVEFKDVDIIFGSRAAEAAAMLDQGKTRAEILAATGSVLGAAGANLVVNEGEISVLMGLSGSGKSTLLRAVNGLNKVTRGKVIVHGAHGDTDVVSCSEDELRKVRRGAVAMVFQQFALLPLAHGRRKCRPRPRAVRRAGGRAEDPRRQAARSCRPHPMGRKICA